MKIIDLYNKIANGEQVPQKIKYIFYEDGSNIFTYNEEEKEYENGYEYLSVPNHHLNDEVEIIDESKECNIKNLDINITTEQQFTINGKVIYKINQLIDEVNKLKENK